jgi:hypothetical protein
MGISFRFQDAAKARTPQYLSENVPEAALSAGKYR